MKNRRGHMRVLLKKPYPEQKKLPDGPGKLQKRLSRLPGSHCPGGRSCQGASQKALESAQNSKQAAIDAGRAVKETADDAVKVMNQMASEALTSARQAMARSEEARKAALEAGAKAEVISIESKQKSEAALNTTLEAVKRLETMTNSINQNLSDWNKLLQAKISQIEAEAQAPRQCHRNRSGCPRKPLPGLRPSMYPSSKHRMRQRVPPEKLQKPLAEPPETSLC